MPSEAPGASSGSGSGSGTGSGSGSDSDSSSSGGTERATVLGASFRLPRELCERPAIFREFLSTDAWAVLSEAERRHLRRFLPDFQENDAEEKEKTVQRLFARDNFKFSSPLDQFHARLRAGAYRPGGARLRKAAAAAASALAKRKRRRTWRRTLRDVTASRERLLALADAAPPPLASLTPPAPPPPEPRIRRIDDRTRRRYFQELASIRSQVYGDDAIVSDDETYPEGPPPPLPKQYCKYLNELQDDNATIISTFGRGLHFINGTTCFNEEWKRRALSMHRKKRDMRPNSLELITNGITLGSVRNRTGEAYIRNEMVPFGSKVSPNKIKRIRPTPPVIVPKAPPPQSESESDGELSRNKTPIFSTPVLNNSNAIVSNSITTATSLPPPLVLVVPKTEIVQDNTAADEEIGLQLVQATQACFFSVIRDLVCSTQRHCLPLHSLESRLRNWRQNPIAPLNHWYSGVEDWIKALPSAVSFLSGESLPQSEDFVPYLQYKPATQVYQWIGAGRDSDALLSPLCTQWLSQRHTSSAPTPVNVQPVPEVPTIAPSTENVEVQTSAQQINKWNNRWQITTDELEAFRVQEVARFQRPHRSFVYHLPRGKVVVGPLKGVYGCDEPGSGTSRVARGHTLLTATRPRHVTLLSLVRDAVACLPGGEGTRAHITGLVRRSQYIVADASEQALQAAVSGALDRMHAAPDPCVHYLPPRKLWVYLHGERTEEEFERLHAEIQIQNKNKASANSQHKKSSAGSKTKQSRNKVMKPPVENTGVTTHIEEEMEGEEINVDVESPDISTTPLKMEKLSPSLTTIATSASSLPMETSTTSIMSGSSLLQQRPPSFTTTMLKRGVATIPTGTSRSVVRVLSSTTSTGKSLISPHALKSATPPPTPDASSRSGTLSQTKVVVQRPGGQTSGSLSLMQQRRLLESLMRHQRQHGQPMTHDQLLHTINNTQKMSSSPSSVTTTSTVSVSKPNATAQTAVQLSGQTVQLSSGQTVQLTGQTVQLTGQTVQLGGQTVQLSGQTVQIGGQTVQLTGQSMQLLNQTRTETGVRSPSQRQTSTPLVAKILTNTQIRSGGNVGTGNQSTGLRLSGLNLAQLQGKPLLLQTNTSSNKTQNILLQTSNIESGSGTEQRTTTPRTPTPTSQHTLLLSNLGGQVVRVAGSGTLLGQSLRLQSPNSGVQGTSGVLLGGTALKLQTTPIRLHQNVAGSSASNRVLVTPGRLHGLKLLPVHHSIGRGGNVTGRQVYARIINPASVNVSGGNTAPTPSLIVGVKSSSPASTGSPANANPPSGQLPQNR